MLKVQTVLFRTSNRVLEQQVVGMTNIPEAILAREIGLHYMLIAIVTNYAAGMQDIVSMEEVYEVTKKAEKKLYRLIEYSLKDLTQSYLDDECTKFKEYFPEE